jgi:hypothetical protein
VLSLKEKLRCADQMTAISVSDFELYVDEKSEGSIDTVKILHIEKIFSPIIEKFETS